MNPNSRPWSIKRSKPAISSYCSIATPPKLRVGFKKRTLTAKPKRRRYSWSLTSIASPWRTRPAMPSSLAASLMPSRNGSWPWKVWWPSIPSMPRAMTPASSRDSDKLSLSTASASPITMVKLIYCKLISCPGASLTKSRPLSPHRKSPYASSLLASFTPAFVSKTFIRRNATAKTSSRSLSMPSKGIPYSKRNSLA